MLQMKLLYDQLLTKVNGIEGKVSNTNWLINKSQWLKALVEKYLILLVY